MNQEFVKLSTSADKIVEAVGTSEDQRQFVEEAQDEVAEYRDFKVVNDPGAQLFIAIKGGEEVGFVSYSQSVGRITLLSTGVIPEHRGKGLASALTRQVLDLLIVDGIRVAVRCPVFRGFIKKNPQYAELVKN